MSTTKCEILMTGDAKGQMYNLAVWDPDTGTLLSIYKGMKFATFICLEQRYSGLVPIGKTKILSCKINTTFDF